MNQFNNYKNRYRNAKTGKTKEKVMNSAMLNLPYDEQQKFVAWQVDFMRKTE